MTPDEVEKLFARNGGYSFARWGRPIVPVVFGVEDETLGTIKGAIEAIATLAGIEVAETDPELGANLMVFFFRDWAELLDVPNLGEMIPDLAGTVARLQMAEATQYRAFRFDDAGAIRACFVFVRMSGGMAKLSAEAVALTQAVQAILTWGDGAFSKTSPLALHPETGATILRPEIADVIRAAYDPVMPAASLDPTHALRLFARIQR